MRIVFRDLTSHSNIWHVLSRRLNTWRVLLQKSMERNDNCSLECLLHRLFLTSPTLSNHGACIRWYWKGSVHRFLLSKNTLLTKPFHEAEDSRATPVAPVLVLNYKPGPKQNPPKAPCLQPAIQIAKAKTPTIKIKSFILIYDEDNRFPSPSALRVLCMGRIWDAQKQRH